MNSRWLRQSGHPARVMGVLNCTPDSFSDGAFVDVEDLRKRAELMVEQGASLIDIGGESTRPDAKSVSLAEELKRVIPVVQCLSGKETTLSVDTMKAEVMRQAIAAGATMVNDVSALTFDSESVHVVAQSGVDVCLMHMQGTPQTMQQSPVYSDVLSEVLSFFERRVEVCLVAGIQASSILLDPGIGFGKRLEDNLKLIANINIFKEKLGFPILLGASRKSFLGLMTAAAVADREFETAVASGIGVFAGADVIRVHDCAVHSKTALIASQLADNKQAFTC